VNPGREGRADPEACGRAALGGRCGDRGLLRASWAPHRGRRRGLAPGGSDGTAVGGAGAGCASASTFPRDPGAVRFKDGGSSGGGDFGAE